MILHICASTTVVFMMICGLVNIWSIEEFKFPKLRIFVTIIGIPAGLLNVYVIIKEITRLINGAN